VGLTGQWNPNHCSIHEMFRFHVYCLQRLAIEVETQKKGLVLVFDVSGMGLHHVRHFTPSVVKSLALILQDSFPMRFQAVHIINEPWIFKMIVSLVWPLLSEKMRNRVSLHISST
jgi:CRAL/TRIO domain